MALQLGSIIFGNSAGAWAFASLIPFIIIYLIRPRPQVMEIPSLMFLMVSSASPKQQSFLRRFARDWLFLIQLLTLLLLAVHFMQPFTKYQHDVTSQNTVIVIDATGSSQTKEGTTTRFDRALTLAKTAVGVKNTIILARSTSKIVMQDGSAQDALELLESLKPSDTPSALGEAMLLASETLGNKEGRVVVLSDFINTQGIDPATAHIVLKSKNIAVDLINTAGDGPKNNIGITGMDVSDEVTTVFIHNFNSQISSTKLTVGDFTKDLMIQPKATESFSFKTPERLTTLKINTNDDFPLDDTAYLSAPEHKKIRVLLYTNNASVFLTNALTSSPLIELSHIEPPLPPQGDFDVYVIADIFPDKVLPGTFETIADFVRKGKSAVVHAQDGFERLDLRSLSPVRVISKGTGGKIFIEQINKFTKNIDFGRASEALIVEKAKGSVSVASSLNTSIITYQPLDDGKTLYFGILEKASDFKLSPDYPIFWVRLLQFLTDQENIKNLNLKTGDTVVLETPQKVSTPTGKVTTNALYLDQAGIYTFEDRTIAVNLLNDVESDVNPQKKIGEQSGQELILKPVKEDRQFNLEIPLLGAAIAILLLELLYIKMRGDV